MGASPSRSVLYEGHDLISAPWKQPTVQKIVEEWSRMRTGDVSVPSEDPTKFELVEDIPTRCPARTCGTWSIAAIPTAILFYRAAQSLIQSMRRDQLNYFCEGGLAEAAEGGNGTADAPVHPFDRRMQSTGDRHARVRPRQTYGSGKKKCMPGFRRAWSKY
jgi:hypothetical protein